MGLSALLLGMDSSLEVVPPLEVAPPLSGFDAVGGDGVVGLLAGGASALVVVQLLKRLWILEMANSCLWCTVVATSLTAKDRKLRAWTILSSRVTSGWVRYSWSTLVLSEIMIDFVVASTT